MAKRRTRKDKVSAKHTYQLGDWYSEKVMEVRAESTLVRRDEIRVKNGGWTAEQLYGYDPRLIVGDMKHTLIVATVVLAAELVLFYYNIR
jgi:hypothetical protein